jgi:hypothetical protein
MGGPMDTNTTTMCGGCGAEVLAGQPTFVFDEVRYHVDCVPAEQSSRAQSLLGVKSC